MNRYRLHIGVHALGCNGANHGGEIDRRHRCHPVLAAGQREQPVDQALLAVQLLA